MFRKKSIIGVTGLFATLLTGQALAVEGQYTDNTRYWSRTYDKSYGHSKINVSLNYHNRAEMFHTGLTSYMANQHVKARTSFTLKANGLGTSRTLLEASVAGQSVNYHNSNTDSYQASGLIKLEGNDYLPSTTYKDFNEGSASLYQPFLVEKNFFESKVVETTWCDWQVKVRGKLEGGVWADASRTNANRSTLVIGRERAKSRMEASAQVIARVICWNPLSSDKRLGELELTAARVSATPKAYSSEDVFPLAPESQRVIYMYGIDNPLTVGGGGGRISVAGHEFLEWDDFSSSAGLGKYDTSERYGTTWY